MAESRQTIGPSVATTVVAAIVAMCGCTSSPPVAGHATALSLEAEATPPSPRPTQPGAPGYHPEQQAPTSAPDPQAMHRVIAEIQELGAMDPGAREELLENLKQTDPRLWPLVVQQVRANLAWRQRVEQREMVAGSSSVSPQSRSPWPSPPRDQAAVRSANGESGGTQSPSESFPRQRGLPAGGSSPPASNHAALPPPKKPAGARPSTGDPTRSDKLARTPPPDRQAEDEPAAEVIALSHQSKADDDWQTHLEEAIRLLESDVARSPQSDGESARQARLRMLYLLGNRRDEALRPVPSLAPAMQDFWSKQLYGLATLMDPQQISESSHRKAEAKQHLDAAVSKLGESCPLVVSNLAFVTEIELFGRYKPFEKYQFEPGQEVLLYAELENFESKETPRGFHTATRSSYQIFDSSGRRVAEHEFSPSEEYCPTARRDYFIGHQFTLPRRIFPGKHVLQLTVADLNSEKIGQSLIEFAVKSTDD